MSRLDEALARSMAAIALGHVAREYPNLPGHVLYSDEDAQPPRVLHPAFFGSYDWHSCVHGWWTLLTLRRLFPHTPEAAEIAALTDATFTPEKIAGEVAYFLGPSGRTFQRPYGWSWLLTLHLEALRHTDRPWGEHLAPLAETIAARWPDYLSVLTYPIRVGTHANSAFALVLSLAWAERFDRSLAAAMRERARSWFASDRNSPALEPGGDEFLSPTLTEALCMAQSLPPEDVEFWLAEFLPDLSEREPAALFEPARVSDRSDYKIAHLDGLNLSRAWCWFGLAPFLPDRAQAAALHAAESHLASALPHLADAYAGEHWLASFALLALLAGDQD